MVDPAEVLQNPAARHTERAQLRRDWILSLAECSRRAKEAIAKAAEVLAEDVPGRRPDAEVAQAWAAVAQGWETLSHAEAARSVAAAAFTVDQTALASTPRSRSATAVHGRTRRCGRPLRTYPRQTGDGPGGVRSRREGEQYDHLASHMLSGNRGRP